LQKKIGEIDYEKFKDTIDKYYKRDISKKEFILEGKKQLGDKFTGLFY